MRLRRVNLVRFMQFIDQQLEVDPRITVLVGRNDVGKTAVLRWFFDQHVKERAIHSRAKPLIKGYEADPISFGLLWETEDGDRDRYPLKEAFGREDVRRIELGFRHEAPDGKDYWIAADGTPVDIYEPDPKSPGQWVMQEVYASRRLFPIPYYLSLGDKQIMPSMFEARFYDPAGSVEALFVRELVPTEELLLRLVGLHAQTRHSSGSGVDEPWGGFPLPRSAVTLDEIEGRLERVSQQLSSLIAEWWQDPRGLRINVRIGGPRSAREYQHKKNSYGITWQAVDPDGIPYYGAGLQWFVTLLVELLWLESSTSQLLVLIDEPAYSLHPTAQRMVAKILSNLSDRHQIIYSTHSPFMIDWSFPQRIRLIERDPETKRATIINKPYHPTQSYQISWDPVREAIGVSMGDLAVLGDRNLLVEGVSDQILLANASVALVDSGDLHSNLTGISIVTFGDDVTTLARLLDRIDKTAGRALVLTDSDKAGDDIVKFCARRNAPVLQVGRYVSGRPLGQDVSIEDLVGANDYLRVVNDFYTPFPWFAPLDLSTVPREGRSLGRFVADAFEQTFAPRRFDKIAVAVALAETLRENPGLAKTFVPLLQDVMRSLRGGP